MNAKTLGTIQLLGGLYALWQGWGSWATVALAVVIIIMAFHHFMEK